MISGPGSGSDGDLRRAGQFRIGRATEADGHRAQAIGFGDRAQNIRRAAAGRDAAKDIGGGETARQQVARADGGIVFRGFGGARQAASPPAIMPCTRSGGDAESGRAFRGVQHAETSAGSRADIEQPAAARECFDDGIHGARDMRQFRRDRLGDLAVFIVDDAQHLQRGQSVDAARMGVGLLGEKSAQRRFGLPLMQRSHVLTGAGVDQDGVGTGGHVLAPDDAPHRVGNTLVHGELVGDDHIRMIPGILG